jgi:hypothetical protein
MSISTYPRIVRFFETSDAPDSECPHCGASGRYILNFQVEDGRRLAAMRGCAKLFPTAPIAYEELRLADKLKRLRKSYGPQAHLNRNDTRAMEAIEAFYAGQCSEDQAMLEVKSAKAANSAKYRR